MSDLDLEQIKAQVEDLRAQIEGVFPRLSDAEQGLEMLAGIVQLLRDQSTPAGERPLARGEVPWGCKRCGARLGIYDEQEDLMRLPSAGGGFLQAVRLGEGGWVEATCSSCGTSNRAEFTPAS